jgi:hypothetical protein
VAAGQGTPGHTQDQRSQRGQCVWLVPVLFSFCYLVQQMLQLVTHAPLIDANAGVRGRQLSIGSFRSVVCCSLSHAFASCDGMVLYTAVDCKCRCQEATGSHGL